MIIDLAVMCGALGIAWSAPALIVPKPDDPTMELGVVPQLGPSDVVDFQFVPEKLRLRYLCSTPPLMILEGTGDISVWNIDDVNRAVKLATFTLDARAFALHPNGDCIAVSASDGSVDLYDVETLSPTFHLMDCPAQAPSRIEFSGNGKFIAVTFRSPDHTIMWSVPDDPSKLHGNSDSGIDMGSNVSLRFVGRDDARLLQSPLKPELITESGAPEARIRIVGTKASVIATDTCSPTAVMAVADDAQLWEMSEGHWKSRPVKLGAREYNCAVLAGRRGELFLGDDHGDIHCTGLLSSYQSTVSSGGEYVSILRLSPDQELLAALVDEEHIGLWEIDDFEAAALVEDIPVNQEITHVARRMDNRLLVVESGDPLRWTLTSASSSGAHSSYEVNSDEDLFGGGCPTAASDDGTTVALAPEDGKIYSYDATSHSGGAWSRLHNDRLGHERSDDPTFMTCVAALSSTGALLATGDNRGSIDVWDTRQHLRMTTINGPVAKTGASPQVTAVAFALGDSEVIIGYQDGTICRARASDGDVLATHKPSGAAESGPCQRLDCGSPGMIIASQGGDRAALRVLDCETLAPLRVLEAPPDIAGDVVSIGTSTQTSWIVAAYEGNIIRAWDGKSGRILWTIAPVDIDTELVWTGFSRATDRLTAIWSDGQVREWTTLGLHVRGPILKYRESVDCCAFADAGRLLIAANNGSVRQWEVARSGISSLPTLTTAAWRNVSVASEKPYLAALVYRESSPSRVAFMTLGAVSSASEVQLAGDGWSRISLSPGGKYLVGWKWPTQDKRSISVANVFKINAARDELTEVLKAAAPITSVAFSLDEQTIGVVTDDNELRLLQGDSGAVLRHEEFSEDTCGNLAISPRGTRYAVQVGKDVRIGSVAGDAEVIAAGVLAQQLWFVTEESLAIAKYGRTSIVGIVPDSPPSEVGLIRSGIYSSISLETEGRLAGTRQDSGCVDVLDAAGNGVGMLLVDGTSALCVGRSGRWCGTGDLVRGLTGRNGDWVPFRYEEILRMQQADCAWREVLGRTTWYDGLVSVWQGCVVTAEDALLWYEQRPVWQKVLFWPGLAYVVLLALWTVRPSLLAQWAMRAHRDKSGEGGAEGIDSNLVRIARVVSLVRTLGESERAVGAWSKRNAFRLNERCFDGRADVQYRKTYAVSSDSAEIIATWRVDGHEFDTRPLWIWGPGGCGKTSLAMYAAQALRNSGNGSRRKGIESISVIIDKAWPSSIEERIAYMLRVDGRQPSVAMVRRLGRMGEIVLLIDGESEVALLDARTQVEQLCESTAWKWLMVTSRRPSADPEIWRSIEMGPLDGQRIEAVVQAYGGSMWESVANSVDRWRRGRSLKAGIVRKVVNLVIDGRDLPLTEADIVREHLRSIAPRGDGKLAEEEFLRAVRVCAVACMTAAGQPRVMSRDFVLGFVAGAVTRFVDNDGRILEAPEVVNQLVECGVLEVVEGESMSDVRFAEDFVAETAVRFAA